MSEPSYADAEDTLLTAVLVAIEPRDGCLRLLDRRELDDTRALRPAVLEENLGVLDSAGRLEEFDEVLVRSRVRELRVQRISRQSQCARRKSGRELTFLT